MKRNERIAFTFLIYASAIIEITNSLSTPSDSSATESIKFASHLKTKIASSVAKTERREKERSLIGRKICERCKRPPVLCVCKSLPEKLISTSTHVLILQHPREFRRRSLSTVPLIPLVLEKCTIKVGYNFTPDQLHLVQECLDRGQKPLLLFPGPSAIDLDGDRDNAGESDDCASLQNLQREEQLLILVCSFI